MSQLGCFCVSQCLLVRGVTRRADSTGGVALGMRISREQLVPSIPRFDLSISAQTVGGHVIQYLCYFFSSFVKAKGVFYDGFLWRRAIREFRRAWRQGKKVNYYLRPMSKLIARLRWGNSNKALSLAYIEQIMILLFVLQE